MAEGHVVEDGGRRWVITLRPGLVFHDGTPVLARDCVASLNRWMRRDSLGGTILARLDAVEARLGPCDLLVNNAGIAATKPFLDHGDDDWDSVMGVDLRGAFVVAREAAKRMVAAKKPGSIVNIASIGGTRVVAGVAGYTAAKAGLLHLTRQMAVELARHRIRVNALAPGYIETDINRDFFATEAGLAQVRRIPQRRLGRPEGLDGPLLLLASQAGSFITGTALVADGGHLVSPL